MLAVQSSPLDRCIVLGEQHRALSQRLAVAARILLDESRLPESALLDELTDYRQAYASLAQAAGVDMDLPLVEIRQQIEQIDRRRRATASLEHCLRIESAATCDALSCFHERIREWQSRIDGGEDAVELLSAIEDGSHPALQLLRIVEEPETCTDQDWLQTLDVIKSELGTGLAVAVARGRLLVRDQAGDSNRKCDQEPST